MHAELCLRGDVIYENKQFTWLCSLLKNIIFCERLFKVH